ncbi:MAG: FkbM family methyltransferase [Chlorogloeopsis fritschii C42_A2020_084]|uniref:FkbM family methyltransferase n=1 Tax=Chlorogloeopsis fritschii TaxID=1124 RepID=UPI001A0DB8C7|nr:FkbM family methyltransferase [Chlorogloeopsis fritschii]MBF2005174.1 FkbM family methyltransferase [Chlorogloeopsis fritschii C42_A2020_084]
MKIEDTLMKLCPKSLRLPIKYQYHKIRNRLEQEIFYLKKLGGTRKRAIDIGANIGIYSYVLSQLYEVVEVFEPQSWCTEYIADYSQVYASNLNIHNVGLADFNGSLNLYVPVSQGDYSKFVRGLGSLTTGLGSFREIAGEKVSVSVPVRKLDDYNFQDVSLIKIDVEGYETKVIEGGRQTILREKPIIFIEVEQRHLDGKSIEEVFEKIAGFGYEGNFLDNDSLIPISHYSQHIKDNQNKFLSEQFPEKYINNFIFKPVV